MATGPVDDWVCAHRDYTWGHRSTSELLVTINPLLFNLSCRWQLITKLTAAEQAQYAGAGAIAEEVIGSIRTIMAFGGEEKEVER